MSCKIRIKQDNLILTRTIDKTKDTSHIHIHTNGVLLPNRWLQEILRLPNKRNTNQSSEILLMHGGVALELLQKKYTKKKRDTRIQKGGETHMIEMWVNTDAARSTQRWLVDYYHLDLKTWKRKGVS